MVVAARRLLDVQDVADGGVAKPGKVVERRKCSPSAVSSHSPCLEMFVTSIVEVVAPGIDNLLVVLVYESFDVSELCTSELVIVGKFNLRLLPSLASPSLQ